MQREAYRVTAEFEESHWWFRSRRDLLARQLARAAAERGFPARRLELLDYGCGTGRNLRLLAGFGDACGADLPDPHAREFLDAGGFPVLDLSADLAPHRGRFDVVTALDVLEHLDDDVAGLRAMRSLLAAEGALILTVPAYGWLWGGEDVLSQHRRRYTRRSLADACERAGLRIRFLSYFNLAILPAAAAVVSARRLRSREPARSNLRAGPAALSALLYRITALEARWVGGERSRLPAGTSLLCRCTSPAP